MNNWSDTRNTSSVLLMSNVAMNHGMTKQDCLKDTGITEAMLNDGGAEIKASQELKLIENIVDALGQTNIALEIGPRYHLTTYGIWGFAFASSPTLRAATEIGLRFLSLTFAFSHIHLKEEGEWVYLYVDGDHLPEKLRRFVVERDGSAIVNIHKELFSHDIPVTEMSFTWPAPDNLAEYEKVFGMKGRFDQPRNCVVFHRDLLDIPLPSANEATRQLLINQCQTLLQQRCSRSGVADHVRRHLVANLDQNIDMEQVAKLQCVSLRTLRRQLTSEGTSFRTLMDEVRETLAMELIQSTNLTMEQIALRLGYADTANFFHAFKRWKGSTPNSFRA
jgi:AraC-like DNA-binding protein